jgi:hypothetical protein
MSRTIRSAFLFFLIALAVGAPPLQARPVENVLENENALAEKFIRTELYFGMSKKDGSEVSEADWNAFLDHEITPRFPEGFTVLFAIGQFRSANGQIVREKSRVIIFLYPKRVRKAAGLKIDEIRAAYVEKFEQESVLRVTVGNSVSVSF